MTKRFSMTYGKYHDNLTKKEYDEKLESWKVCDLLNSLWEQTQRFEKHNQELVQRSIKYEDDIDGLKNKIKSLTSNDQAIKLLDKRISALKHDIDLLKNNDEDLNPDAVQDVLIVLEISISCLNQFRAELMK